MDTRLVLHGRIAVESGHRVEISEAVDTEAAVIEAVVTEAVGVAEGRGAGDDIAVDAASGWVSIPPGVVSLVDLDTGVRYQFAQISRTPVRRWTAHIVDCLVLLDGPRERTVLTVAPLEGERSGADGALRDASAAVDAAKAEAARWGGSARSSASSPQRIW